VNSHALGIAGMRPTVLMAFTKLIQHCYF